jgi:hypothetical protein
MFGVSGLGSDYLACLAYWGKGVLILAIGGYLAYFSRFQAPAEGIPAEGIPAEDIPGVSGNLGAREKAKILSA